MDNLTACKTLYFKGRSKRERKQVAMSKDIGIV